MEGDGLPWVSEPVSGPGPGGGGMIRELCRGFGRYRRYLGRLRQNLRETQKFFRDIKCSHHHSCPSSPTGGGGGGAEPEPGPGGDVAETGLQAGKEDRPEERKKIGGWTARLPLQNNPGKRRKVGVGPRGRPRPGPGWRWAGGGDTEGSTCDRGARRPDCCRNQDPGDPAVCSWDWGGRVS
jgi:hypothetical protein